MSIFRDTFQPEIKQSLEFRQKAMTNRTPQVIQYMNSRNSWIRMTSAVNVNGTNTLASQYILQGGTLNSDKTLKSGIGNTNDYAYSTVSPGGNKHRLGIRPMPGITSLSIKSKSAYGSLREATIKFQCWDVKQLEDLEILYMRPGYTVLVEWGWVPYFDESEAYRSTFTNFYGDNILNPKTYNVTDILNELYKKSVKAGGNYDALYGYIKNYEWSAREDGGYDCSTTIISIGELVESLKVNYLRTDLDILYKTDNGGSGSLGKGLLDDLFETQGNNPSIKFADYYQKNTLAGTWAELALKIKDPNAKRGSNVIIKDKWEDITFPGLKDYGDFDKFIEPGSPIKSYITLEAAFDIINKYILAQAKPGNTSLVRLSTKAETYSGKGGGDLLCVAHPLQISIDPTVCVVKNSLWYEEIAPAISGSVADLTTTLTTNVVNQVLSTSTTYTPCSKLTEGNKRQFILDVVKNVLSDDGKSKKYTDIIPLDGGTVGISHFATGGLGTLYRKMGEALVKKYFGNNMTVQKMVDNYSERCLPERYSGEAQNDTGWGCYSGGHNPLGIKWKEGMTQFLNDANNNKIQDDAVVASREKSINAAEGKGWNTPFEWATAIGISNSKGDGGFKKLAEQSGWDAVKTLKAYVDDQPNNHRKKRSNLIYSHYPPCGTKGAATTTTTTETAPATTPVSGSETTTQQTSTTTVTTFSVNDAIASVQALKQLKKEFFYEGNPSKELGTIGNIYVSLDFLYRQSLNRNLESGDSKEKNEIDLYKYIKSVASGIQVALGNINSFEVHVDPVDNVARIIDINYAVPTTPSNLFTLKLQNTNSIVRSYKIQSQIFPNQSALVTLGSQSARGRGVQGTQNNTLIDFNSGLSDRIVKDKEDPKQNSLFQNTTSKPNLAYNVANIVVLLGILGRQVPEGAVNNVNIGELVSKAKNSLRDIIVYFQSLPGIVSPGRNRGVLPLKYSFTMDGIGGLVIGSLFRVENQFLPKGYKGTKNIGADLVQTISGIQHEISNGDWTTTIEALNAIIDRPDNGNFNNYKKIITEQIKEATKAIVSAGAGIPPVPTVATGIAVGAPVDPNNLTPADGNYRINPTYKNLVTSAKACIGISTAVIPGSQNGRMGCGYGTSIIFLRATGYQLTPGKDLNFSTREIYPHLEKSTDLWEKRPVLQGQPGDIIITRNDGTGRKGGAGHIGVIIDTKGADGSYNVISNSSNGFSYDKSVKVTPGSIQNNYTVKRWHEKISPRNPSESAAFRYKGPFA